MVGPGNRKRNDAWALQRYLDSLPRARHRHVRVGCRRRPRGCNPLRRRGLPDRRRGLPDRRRGLPDARDCGALRCVLRGVARASARLRVRLFCGRVSGIDQRLARLFCGRVSVIEPRLARFFIKKQTTHKNASHPIRNIRVHTYLLRTLINIVTIFTDGLVIKNTRTAKTPTQNCQTLKHKANIYIYIYIAGAITLKQHVD